MLKDEIKMKKLIFKKSNVEEFYLILKKKLNNLIESKI
jgi:hypothetical protein